MDWPSLFSFTQNTNRTGETVTSPLFMSHSSSETGHMETKLCIGTRRGRHQLIPCGTVLLCFNPIVHQIIRRRRRRNVASLWSTIK